MNDKPPTPKRGAFPTPKEVIDKAPKYVPEDDQADDQKSDLTNRPPDQTQPQGDQDEVGVTDKDKDSMQK